jgi:hypothetical protein
MVTIFWDTTPRSPVEVHRRFGGTHCLRLQERRVNQILRGCLYGLFFHPENGGNTFLQKASELLPDYITSHATEDVLMFAAVRTSNPIHFKYIFR